jgi:hypothetical protein
VWGFTIESYRKIEISYINVDPKHGIKMGSKNSTLSDIIKIVYVIT